MRIYLNKTIRQLATLFILLAIAMPSFSQQLTLPKNSDGYYIINSDNDYETFRLIVAIGNPYANAVLTKDITVRHAIGVGDEQFHYRGTFDGQGHSVYLAGEKDSDIGASSGMFAFTKPGCVIRNLGLKGTLYPTELDCVGALVNDATGTIIERCISDVNLYKTKSDQYVGGLVGVTRAKCSFEHCGFVGRMYRDSKVHGFVAHNTENLSMKSCFSAPSGIASGGSGYASYFTDKMEDCDAFMNNYYVPLPNNVDGIQNNISRCNSLSMEDSDRGRLCYLLNKEGKKGTVWYQNGSRGQLYPFPVSGANYVSSPDNGATYVFNPSCAHVFSSSICIYCGAIEPEKNVEPLQESCALDAHNNLYVDDIWYEYHDDGLIVTAMRYESQKTVHIPEIVAYVDKKLPVTGIKANAFKGNTALEYCYIPKTVTEIGENAFSGCSNLKYVHIADCEASAAQDGLTVAMDAFASCTSLETLYLGRNLKFNKVNYAGQANTYLSPFSTDLHLHNIWFGSKVSYIGNVNNNEVDQMTYLGGGNVQKVYIMGDENSLNRYIDVKTYSDLARATDFYINRTLSGNCFSSMRGDKGGLLDGCVKATFGPYVTAINTDMFAGEENHAKPLQTLDLTFATNIEAIGDRAFRFCENLDIELLDLTQTKITSVGPQTFYGCKKIKDVLLGDKITEIKDYAFGGCVSLSAIKIPSAVTSIGTQAFGGCNSLTDLRFEDSDTELDISSDQFLGTNVSTCYIGRDLKVSDTHASITADKSCVWKIGGKVNNLYKSLFEKSSYQAMYFEYSDKLLWFDDYFNGGVNVVGLDREVRCINGTAALPFKDKTITSFINLGSNISIIPQDICKGYSNVDFLIIPQNVKEIYPSAFQGCSNIKILSIMGNTEIHHNAFTDCTNLEYLYLLNDSISIDILVFDGCNKIKEISTVFTKDPVGKSYSYAFTDATYQNAYLSTADDYTEIEFTSDPWKKFKNQGSTLHLQAVYDGSEDSREDISGVIADYNRASSPCKLTKGQFSLIYLPFDVDSYIFGSDAEIYHLKNSGDSYTDNTETVNDHLVDNVEFERVDIDTQKTLLLGEAYLVKPNHDIESMGGYFSFFDANSIAVDSYAKNRKSSSSAEDFEMYGQRDEKSWAGFAPAIYFVNDGVVKVINGDYVSQPYDLYFANSRYETTPAAFNLLNGNTELLTSKTNLTFNKSLEGYSSFYAADHNYIAPDWCNVFVVTSALNGDLTMEEITDRTITKGQAVLLKSSRELNGSDITEYLTYATHGSKESSLYDSNLLKGVTEETPAKNLSTHGFVYVLSCNAAGTNTGFYKLSGDRKMPAGKAYLEPSTLNPNLLAKSCLFEFSYSATGITLPDADNANVQRIYDMMGRRLKAAGNKGIYIINNKKVLK